MIFLFGLRLQFSVHCPHVPDDLQRSGLAGRASVDDDLGAGITLRYQGAAQAVGFVNGVERSDPHTVDGAGGIGCLHDVDVTDVCVL
jgi:hypothetical protein